MAWIDTLLRSLSPHNIERAARMYDELPHVQKAYSPRAVANAFEWAPLNDIVAMRPRDFRNLSEYLPDEQAAPYVKHYKDLLEQKRWVEPEPGAFMEHYLETVRNQPFEGFSGVPFLQYKQDPTSKIRGQIMGHEGRHRFRAIEDLFGPDLDWPVRISDTHDRLPKSPLMVYPQGGMLPAIDLSRKPRYARGGLVQMREGPCPCQSSH